MVICRADRLAVRATAKFARAYEAVGCPVGVTVDPEKKENEPWRRITGMTVTQEPLMDRKERRAGIKDLVDWIEAWVKENGRGANYELRGELRDSMGLEAVGEEWANFKKNADNNVNAVESEDAHDSRSPHLAFASLTSVLSPAGREESDAWACEGQAREMVVGVCEDLNISRHKLSELTREYRGIPATELIDGFRVMKVKSGIAELLKAYARELWLSPGLYVGVLVMDERLSVYGGGASAYFVDPTESYRKKELWETRGERRGALIAAFDGGWKRGGNSRAGFAARLGFRSFSELNRACVNVFGKTVRDLAWEIGGGIIEFYLAKEQDALRELAVCEPASARIARARYLYRGDALRPEGDAARVSVLWDALDADWRERMEGWLGTG